MTDRKKPRIASPSEVSLPALAAEIERDRQRQATSGIEAYIAAAHRRPAPARKLADVPAAIRAANKPTRSTR